MNKKIHQFSAGFNPGDAISNEMIAIKKILKDKLNLLGEIYSENIGAIDSKVCKKFKSYKYHKNDIIIYHHSIHSSVLEYIIEIPVPKILIYHNVTPHHFFEPYDLKLTYYLKQGRNELSLIKNKFNSYLADSEYNSLELLREGITDIKVLPILYDFNKFKKKPKPTENNSKKKIIFVGRIAPNKKQDDLIRFAKVFCDNYSKDFEFRMIGYCSKELEIYNIELLKMIEYLNLQEHIFFSNFVDDNQINTLYQEADLFISMSEHEGFCVPLLEAMFHNIPIIAYNAGAVKETLKGSGILIHKKDFVIISELAYRLLYEPEFREKIIRKQDLRLQEFINYNNASVLVDEVKKLL